MSRETYRDENGVEHPERRRNPEIPRWIRVVIALGAVMMIGTFAIAAWFVGGVKDLESQNHANALVACAQANISRAGDVNNLRQDIARLKTTKRADLADVAALKRLPEPDPIWIQAREDEIEAIDLNIRQKHKSIRVKLNSIEPFPIRPGSPVKDCERAYPD